MRKLVKRTISKRERERERERERDCFEINIFCDVTNILFLVMNVVLIALAIQHMIHLLQGNGVDLD